MSLSYNLRIARDAILYVQEQLPRGSGNQTHSPTDGAACVSHVRSTIPLCAPDYIPHLAHRAVEVGCGNCAEQAAVAYIFLQNRGVQPLDYMLLSDNTGTGIHVFVVIGFKPDEGTSGWGKEAVICDPWDDGRAYPADQIVNQMSLYQAGYSVAPTGGPLREN